MNNAPDEEVMESTPSDCGPHLDLGNDDTPDRTIVQKTQREMAIDLIQTVEPGFSEDKAMWKAKTPLHKILSYNSMKKLRNGRPLYPSENRIFRRINIC